jgi:hypothetical protein
MYGGYPNVKCIVFVVTKLKGCLYKTAFLYCSQ